MPTMPKASNAANPTMVPEGTIPDQESAAIGIATGRLASVDRRRVREIGARVKAVSDRDRRQEKKASTSNAVIEDESATPAAPNRQPGAPSRAGFRRPLSSPAAGSPPPRRR